MSTPTLATSAPAARRPRRSRRFRLGLALLAVTFFPALLKAAAPVAWAELPDAARWTLVAVSGLCTLAIVALTVTGDYGDAARGGNDDGNRAGGAA